jgi:hypothetical protein
MRKKVVFHKPYQQVGDNFFCWASVTNAKIQMIRTYNTDRECNISLDIEIAANEQMRSLQF